MHWLRMNTGGATPSRLVVRKVLLEIIERAKTEPVRVKLFFDSEDMISKVMHGFSLVTAAPSSPTSDDYGLIRIELCGELPAYLGGHLLEPECRMAVEAIEKRLDAFVDLLMEKRYVQVLPDP